jgi:hypothetical protein
MNKDSQLQREPGRFGQRFYAWSLEEARREVEAGFPSLRLFRSGPAHHALAILESMPVPSRFPFLSTLIRRRMRAEAEEAGSPFTDADEAGCRRFYDTLVYPTPEEFALRETERSNPKQFRFDRRQFAKRLKASLRPILGVEPESLGSGCWTYRNTIEGVEVATTVDLGGSSHQLVYDHRIMVEPRAFRTSLLSWLGVSGQTDWSYLTEPDTASIADQLASLCEHLLKAAPSLLKPPM